MLEPKNAGTLHAGRPITDVADFFCAITQEYEYFERSVLQVTDKIPGISPQQILLYCNDIGEQRSRLAAMDEQMLAIVELAGSEIADTTMVQTYRLAFGRALMACNNLSQKLMAFRAEL